MALCGCTEDAKLTDSSATDVLILGLEGCGKTLLIRRLQSLNQKVKPEKIPLDTVSTVGTELYDINLGRDMPFKRIRVRELGGQMLPIWPQYYQDCHMVVMVIDLANNAQLPAAGVELYAILDSQELKHKSVCLVLNKADLPVIMARAELEMVLALTDLEKAASGRLRVLETSAVDGIDATSLLNWMIEQKCMALHVPIPARLRLGPQPGT